MSVNEITFKDDLKGKYIFLSASIPSVDRDKKYYLDTNPLDITDAIVVLTRSIFIRSGKIIFGGHPTITPLILSVARDFLSNLKKADFPLLYIYQSQFFDDRISKFTKELLKLGIGIIKWTKAKENREESLKHMRNKMIKEIPLSAAIFLGGMEGIEEEYSIFTQTYPNIPVYPIATTGGAAKRIFREKILSHELWPFAWNYDVQNLMEYLNNSREYSFLMKQIISDIKIKPIYILFLFGEQFQYYSDKTQRIAEWLNQKKDYEVLLDKKLWKKRLEKPESEIDKRETEMVKKADIIVRLVQPTSKSVMQRHEGAEREYRKAMVAGKPVIEIYYKGAKSSLTRPIQERNYKYRIPIHLKRGERLEEGIYRGLEEFKKIKEMELNIPKKELSMT